MSNSSFRPVGLYLCIGTTVPPCVSLLNERERSHLSEGDRIAAGTSDPVTYTRCSRRQVLGHDATEYLIPAWSDQALSVIVDRYTGPFESEVKGLAACLLTGRTYSRDGEGDKPPDGGVKAPLKPDKPRSPPGGNKVQAGGSPDRSPLAKLAFG